MPKAKKQKNGSWRCQLWLGEETQPDGSKKQIVKSFTAPTKAEAEDMASEYRRRYGRQQVTDITLGEAIDRYLASKSEILSPTTLTGYKAAASHILVPLSNTVVRKLSSEIVQNWVNSQAVTYSPKTIRNGLGLLTAAATAADPTFKVRVTLPKKKKPDIYVPSYSEVMRLIGAAHTPNLKKAIMLAAFGSLRRGEVCALTLFDIDFSGGWIRVSKDKIQLDDGTWIVKEIPKTEESNRSTPVPKFVLDELRTGCVDCNPHVLSDAFGKLVKRCGLPHIRFHDLRHFFASYLHLNGVPDAYIEKYGGWKSGSSVMREIYRNTINAEEQQQAARIVDIFSGNRKNARAE